MKALVQVIVLYAGLFLLFRRWTLKRRLLVAVIVSIPLRTDWGLTMVPNAMTGGWSGIKFSVADFVMMALAVMAFGRGSPPAVTVRQSGLPIVAFIAANALSVINSDWLKITVFQVVVLSQIGILYFVVLRRCLLDEEDVKAVYAGMYCSLILQGAIGCLQFGVGENFLLFSTGSGTGETIVVGDENTDLFIRVFGTAGKPNPYGAHLATLLLLCLPAGRLAFLSRWVRVTAISLGSLGLVLSFSRGTWLSTTVALLVYAIRERKRWTHVPQKMAMAAMMAGVLGLFTWPYVRTRLTADDHNSAMSRLPLVTVALRMAAAHPIMGIGANTSRRVASKYCPPDFPQAYVDQVHNLYLTFLSECGLLGLASLLWLLGSLVTASHASSIHSSNVMGRQVASGAFLAMVHIVVYENTEMGNHSLFFVTLMVVASLVSTSKASDSWFAAENAPVPAS